MFCNNSKLLPVEKRPELTRDDLELLDSVHLGFFKPLNMLLLQVAFQIHVRSLSSHAGSIGPCFILPLF